MDYVNLGQSGLKVSKLCLGCMSFGDRERAGPYWKWNLDEKNSRRFFRQALETGINFFDTANIYAAGTSEEFTGRALRDMAKRDEVVVATKAYGKWRSAPNTGGLSRKALFEAVDASLQRLGMDYIDLFQIHRLDQTTPMEESMEALHDIIKSGKVRYIGASSMRAWQFAKLQYLADLNGWTRFISMQPQVNLLYREEEREMIPLCEDMNVGIIPWSPLARGEVARPWNTETNRTSSDQFRGNVTNPTEETDKEIVAAVAAIAEARGVPMAQVALAWVLQKPGITSPIIGATKEKHISDAVAALELKLTEDEVTQLQEHYVTRPVTAVEFPADNRYKLTVTAAD